MEKRNDPIILRRGFLIKIYKETVSAVTFTLSFSFFFPFSVVGQERTAYTDMNIFVCKYRQSRAKTGFILIPVKSVTGSDVAVVVSGQSFPQIVLLG